MRGIHLIADLHACRCDPQHLLDPAGLESYCLQACEQHKLTVVGKLFHPFRDTAGAPAGVTGAVVLAESHLALHTWPEIAAVTLDIYVCNFSADNSLNARALLRQLVSHFAPERLECSEVERGSLRLPPQPPESQPA